MGHLYSLVIVVEVGTLKTSDVHSSCRSVKGFSLGTTRQYDPIKLQPIAEEVIGLFATGKIHISIAEIFK